MMLRREEPITTLACHSGVSETKLHRWREDITGRERASAYGRAREANGQAAEIGRLKRNWLAETKSSGRLNLARLRW